MAGKQRKAKKDRRSHDKDIGVFAFTSLTITSFPATHVQTRTVTSEKQRTCASLTLRSTKMTLPYCFLASRIFIPASLFIMLDDKKMGRCLDQTQQKCQNLPIVLVWKFKGNGQVSLGNFRARTFLLEITVNESMSPKFPRRTIQ